MHSDRESKDEKTGPDKRKTGPIKIAKTCDDNQAGNNLEVADITFHDLIYTDTVAFVSLLRTSSPFAVRR